MNNNLIIKHLRQYKPKDILDYGCGTGSLPYEDYPELNFTAADKRGLESQLSSYENVNFVEIDDHKTQSFIPFSDNQFDFIILRFVLEHVPNPLFYIKEAERISKSGGRIFISVPNYKSFQDRIFRLATKIAGSKQGPHIQKFTFFILSQRKKNPIYN